GRRLCGVPRFSGPRAAAAGGAAQPASLAPQRLAGAALGRPGLSAGLPLVHHGALLAAADRPVTRAVDGAGRGTVALVLKGPCVDRNRRAGETRHARSRSKIRPAGCTRPTVDATRCAALGTTPSNVRRTAASSPPGSARRGD